LTQIFSILSITGTSSPQDYATQYIIVCSLKHGDKSPLVSKVYEALSTYIIPGELGAINFLADSYQDFEAHNVSYSSNVNNIRGMRQDDITIEADLDCQDLRSIEAWSDWNMNDNATVDVFFGS
jgi:hypothetical protein